MSQPTILIVDSNAGNVRRLGEAISKVLLGNIVHWEDGESGVMWVGANDCDLCILSYELPGVDGLETLARMRNRKPHLPAIMISNSRSQDVAIAAFRAGVIDFIPTTRDFIRSVVQAAQRTLMENRGEPTDAPTPIHDPRLEELPPERRTPSYQNRLRVIGRQLDLYEYRSVSVLEVDGGFLVRALPFHSRLPEALEFPDRDFPLLVLSGLKERNRGSTAKHGELFPTGYEDFLRALGYLLDDMRAESVVITELRDLVVVGGRGLNEARLAATMVEPFQMFLKYNDIEYMLDEAFMRRRERGNPEQAPQETVSTGLRGILKKLN